LIRVERFRRSVKTVLLTGPTSAGCSNSTFSRVRTSGMFVPAFVPSETCC